MSDHSLTNTCTCKAEHWQPHADSCPLAKPLPRIPPKHLKDGCYARADALEAHLEAANVENERLHAKIASLDDVIAYWKARAGDATASEPNARQREIKQLEQVVRLNPAEYDPSVATCPCGVCQHYRKLLREQGTPLDQLGKPNAVKSGEQA